MNSLSLDLVKALRSWFDEIEFDETVRSVILTGAPDSKGRPCFSTGADLKDPDLMSGEVLIEGRQLMNKIETTDRVVIAAIDGVCTGGGLELAMCCDIRVGTDIVQVGDLHLKNQGMMSAGGTPARLPRIVGLSNAKLLLFTCKLIDGHEAFRIGLLNKLYSSDELMEGAREIAVDAATLRPTGVKITKNYLNLGIDMNLHQALHFAELVTPLVDPDFLDAFVQGREAFVNKSNTAQV